MANGNTVHIEVTANADKLKRGLANADKSLKGFKSSAAQVTQTTAKMGKTVQANAVPALTSFSQVIQDAPYGIRGVANNITQLTSQFGYLSKSTGGAKAALSSMLGALTGPAGILFAVSAVTSLLVSYGDEISDFITGTDSATKRIERLNTALGDLDVTLDNLKIKKKIADIFGEDTTKLDRKKLDSLKEQLKLQENKLRIAFDAYQIAKDEAKEIGLFSLPTISKSEQKGLDELARNYNNIKNEVDKAKLAVTEFEELLSRGQEVEIDVKVKDTKGLSLPPIDPGTLKADVTEIEGLLDIIPDSYDTAFEEALMNTEDFRLRMTDELKKFMEAVHKINTEIRSVITGGIANSFSMIGEALGDAFANGGNVLQAAGQALTQGLANVLGVMGDYLIKAGAAAVVAATITKTFGTIAGLGAGLAAIAAGTALKALSSGISTKIDAASGGGASGSGASGSSFRGSSTSSSGFSGSGGGTYVFEIAGTKLVGVLKNTLDRNKALGGSLSLTT